MRRLLSLAVALVALAASWTGADAQTLTRVDGESNSPFDKTVKQIEAAVKTRGMMVVAIIDHQNMLRMVGVSIKGSKTIEFGKPDMGKMVLTTNPEAGLEMPARIYIWERTDGKTVVSYYQPAHFFAAYGKENLKMVGGMMDKTLEEIVAEGTK